ncbi:serine/threonine-protein kinase pim-1-like [Danio aesculapii]|uniref:serine/threonine-protein kinase pim-1-like n=1 Tax=Danio aesculapii TaxID=1142201 RepID=UPI0024BF4DBF|nr:serine/threonine-protein kinase pim-1-like [Danio aesculapii]
MGQQISCVNIATETECVYSFPPSTPLQSNKDTPHQVKHQLDETRAVTCEEDGVWKGVKEQKKSKKKSRFWRKLACFRFSRPRTGRGEKVEQVDSEKVKQYTKAEPCTDVNVECIFPSLDQTSVANISCTVEDYDYQQAFNSLEVLPSTVDLQIQQEEEPSTDDQTLVETTCSEESYGPQNTPNYSLEIPSSGVDQQIQELPVNLSEEETVCPLAEAPNQNMVLIIGNMCLTYNMGELLGEGGFGAVYTGVRANDGLPVAIKFARKAEGMEYLYVPGLPELVPLEIGLTLLANKGPSSPNIIELLDWQELPDHYVMVLQRPSPCQSLFKLLESCGNIFEEMFARHVMRQVIEAAETCCRRGVLHRDIKLENLLINTDTMDVTLIDFGCGNLFHETEYHSFSGTEMYCPPEFFETGKYYARSATVFSLGVLLYTMVCGYMPDHTDLEKIQHWLWYLPSLSSECSHLINACLHPDPRERIPLEQILLHDWFTIMPSVVEDEHPVLATQEVLFSLAC